MGAKKKISFKQAWPGIQLPFYSAVGWAQLLVAVGLQPSPCSAPGPGLFAGSLQEGHYTSHQHALLFGYGTLLGPSWPEFHRVVHGSHRNPRKGVGLQGHEASGLADVVPAWHSAALCWHVSLWGLGSLGQWWMAGSLPESCSEDRQASLSQGWVFSSRVMSCLPMLLWSLASLCLLSHSVLNPYLPIALSHCLPLSCQWACPEAPTSPQ